MGPFCLRGFARNHQHLQVIFGAKSDGLGAVVGGIAEMFVTFGMVAAIGCEVAAFIFLLRGF